MSKDDDVLDLLDRPIAFHPAFVKLTGSVNAALMLSQAFYWTKRTKQPGRWFYKTQEDWTKEIYLTRREQEGARKLLRATGFWQEERRGNPGKMFYRVDMTTFRGIALGESSVQTTMAENAILTDPDKSTETPINNGGNVHNPRARPLSSSENTTETTDHPVPVKQKRPRREEPLPDPPFKGKEFLSALVDFEAHRKEMGKSLQPTGRARLYDKLSFWPEEDATQALKDAVVNGWLGVFYPKRANGNGFNGNGHRPDPPRQKTQLEILQEQGVPIKWGI